LTTNKLYIINSKFIYKKGGMVSSGGSSPSGKIQRVLWT